MRSFHVILLHTLIVISLAAPARAEPPAVEPDIKATDPTKAKPSVPSEVASSLVDQLVVADIAEVPKLADKLADYRRWAEPLFTQELSKRLPEQATEVEKERHAKRQANVAVALLRMGNTDKVWPLLKFSPDPRVRSYLVHWISLAGVDPQTIIERLNTEPEVSIRRALVLTLGEFTDTQLPVAQRQPLIEKLFAIYEDDPDAGLHGAAEWLLRKWGQAAKLQAAVEKLRVKDDQLQARKPADKRQWYVNTQGQTFAIIDAGEFLMGSPESEPGHFYDETQHRCRIGRRFAISTMDVTKAQFGRFLTIHPEIRKRNPARWVKTDDSPQIDVTWYEAAAYCNWLSEQEGVEKKQWCYEPNKKGEYDSGMKAKDKYLELSGYRLPTEAEWEYACRAGTVTSRYYGLTDTLLGKHAWYDTNSQDRTWPVGSLKPNDFGLFDMLGNAQQWCDNQYQNYPEAADAISKDLGSTKPVVNSDGRVLRGGAFFYQPEFVRSAHRNCFLPADSWFYFGLRPARTFP